MGHKRKISVVGLGYVGLPVAVAFGEQGCTVGFDVKQSRLEELRRGFDSTNEIEQDRLASADILYTDSVQDLAGADFHIVAVPTPITNANQPDLEPLIRASQTVGAALSVGDIVVYESTVYPGVTEDICVPVLERSSGLRCGVDFTVGYSPERINPGDKEHTFARITKVVSGQDEQTLDTIAEVYGSVVSAGVFKAASIKAAEAAKVIENTQRDLNIALMNELAIIFDRMDLRTGDVLDAASTKWNFLSFVPGLVGGHCIGVDPYYLTHKAEMLGYIPQVILSGRRINDEMGKFVAQKLIKKLVLSGHKILGSYVTVLGLSFKENCPDLRNSKVIDVIRELESFGLKVQVCDPWVDRDEAQQFYGVDVLGFDELQRSKALLVAVAHRQFTELTLEQLGAVLESKPVVIDVKGILKKKLSRWHDLDYWQL